MFNEKYQMRYGKSSVSARIVSRLREDPDRQECLSSRLRGKTDIPVCLIEFPDQWTGRNACPTGYVL
jgi:hypothetical protein